jgi:hypothetical protein
MAKDMKLDYNDTRRMDDQALRLKIINILGHWFLHTLRSRQRQALTAGPITANSLFD